jgi:hypothetical protein
MKRLFSRIDAAADEIKGDLAMIEEQSPLIGRDKL